MAQRAEPAGPPLAEPGHDRARAWHGLAIDRVAALLGTDAERGLAPAEARRRFARVGPNRVAEAREEPLWRLALGQFESLVVLLLLAAAAVAVALGERVEGLAILAAHKKNNILH
jgi:Ca2+-transporting ATPase